MKWLSSLAEPLGGMPSESRVLVEDPAVLLVAGTEATEILNYDPQKSTMWLG